MIKKAVIPAAGSGTRLLPATKEMPKGMLPIFTLGQNGEVCLIPTLQAVFEQLYDTGFREFCFIVGRGKRTIEDHFTPDWGFVEDLNGKNKAKLACRLEGFYEKVNSSTIVFVNQPRPKGFGDAVLRARAFTDNEDFLVHASDDLILSEHDDYLKKLIAVFEEYTADAVLLVERVEDLKGYGVIEG
ncbi:MAG: sugar phosphate nucleotidyltransferase, partial [bacterium]